MGTRTTTTMTVMVIAVPRYDEDGFDEGGGFGRSSRFQGDEDYYNEDYSRNRGRRAYDDSAE
jgi:hypothetical protein